jgi:hypothetical protein
MPNMVDELVSRKEFGLGSLSCEINDEAIFQIWTSLANA